MQNYKQIDTHHNILVIIFIDQDLLDHCKSKKSSR